MWVVKGVLLGLGLFFVGSLIYLASKLRPFEGSKATGISAITALTVYNPFFWIGLAGCLLIGCAVVGFWPAKA